MSIKAGAILFDANGFLVDRIQSGGPGSLNIPEEKIYEVGNWQSVGTVYDIPDLTFDLESFDVTTEFEHLLVGADYNTALDGDQLNFQDAYPMDVISPFKSTRNEYNIINGIAVPYLTLERASYRFGVGQSASQQFSLRGDSIYYIPGRPFWEKLDITAPDSGSTFNFSDGPAKLYQDGATSIYALNVTLVNYTNKTYKRLFAGDGGYTSTSAGVTLDSTYFADWQSDYEFVLVTYGGPAEAGVNDATDYVQSVHAGAGSISDVDNPANPGVKPAAVRAKDIEVYIGSTDATPVWTRLTGVQNAEVTWSVTLENDEELGNERYVSQEYDTPDVSGSVGVKAFDVADLFSKIEAVTGVTSGQVLGPQITQAIPLEIGINDPTTGTRIKTISVPEARFNVPGLNAQVQTKLENTFDFSADTGEMYVYHGDSGNVA